MHWLLYYALFFYMAILCHCDLRRNYWTLFIPLNYARVVDNIFVANIKADVLKAIPGFVIYASKILQFIIQLYGF